MNEKYLLLYNDMLEDIKRSQELDLPEIENIPSGFWIAHNYWEKLKSCIGKCEFGNEKEEIEFFKVVKPRFTAHIDFFTLVAEALVCVPNVPLKAIDYWEEESIKFRRYCDRNDELVKYLESDNQYNDHVFFTRRNAGVQAKRKSLIYDGNPECWSSHDHIVRGFMAHKMYWEYCRNKIKILMETVNH